jgi:hypothetical protein
LAITSNIVSLNLQHLISLSKTVIKLLVLVNNWPSLATKISKRDLAILFTLNIIDYPSLTSEFSSFIKSSIKNPNFELKTVYPTTLAIGPSPSPIYAFT